MESDDLQELLCLNQGDIDESARREREIYETLTEQRYGDELETAFELVDYVFEETNYLVGLNANDLQRVPEAIRVCREMTRPPISQKRLGQMVDFSSLKDIEDGDRDLSSELARDLHSYLTGRFCDSKAPWLAPDEPRQPTEVEIRVARSTIAHSIAKTRTKTFYRNARSKQQEGAIRVALEEEGYTEKTDEEKIDPSEDLAAGEYMTETRVGVGGEHKADLIFCPSAEKIVFIEAKVCGIGVDGIKRQKEIENKKTAWDREFDNPDVITVVSGELSKDKLLELYEQGIFVMWGHKLEQLKDIYSLPETDGKAVDKDEFLPDVTSEDIQEFGTPVAELSEFIPDGGEASAEVGDLCEKPREKRKTRDSTTKLTDF